MRLRYSEELIRTLNRAPRHVQSAVQNNLLDIVARGRARIHDERLRARIVDNWYLYFRYPRAGEELLYGRETYVLVSVEEDEQGDK